MIDYSKALEMKKQGSSLETIRRALCPEVRYKTLQKGLLRYEARSVEDGFTVYAKSVLLDADNNVVRQWVKSSTKDNVYLDLIESIKEIKPFDFKMVEASFTKKLLEIPLFDMHFGPSTYIHYRPHLNEIVGRIRLGYEETIITVGSDMFHHNDMQNKTASGTEIEHLDIRKAWDDALRFYGELISEAVKHSEVVTVYYIKGNHDESLSWAFVQVLKQMFPTVEFDDTFKERKVFLWESIFIGYIHGDKPIKDIDRVFTKENKRAYGLSEVVEIHVGHLHRENAKGNAQDITGTMVRVLSTGNITDGWHDENNYVGSNKRFQLFEYGPSKLNAIYYIDGNL